MPPGDVRKPHVLTLIDVLGHGGAERVAEAIALGANPDRFRRTVCVTRETVAQLGGSSEASIGLLEGAGIDVMRLNRRSRFDPQPLLRLARLLSSGDVDVIHAHKFGSNVWAAALGRLFRVPVVISHEHTWSFEGQMMRRLIDRHVVSRYSHKVIAVSQADRDRMIAIVGMPSERVDLIPNGIPDPEAADGRRTREELGVPTGAPLIVQTAVLRPQKAIDVMVDAMAIVHAEHPEAQLLIVGPGDPAGLQARAEELGVADVVRFLGARSDVADLLAAADVGVLSSDFEGMPLAVLEYMAAGLPVVATNVGGVPEIVQDGETGLLVEPRDSRGLGDRINALLDDPERAVRMGQAGRRCQQARFSQRVMVDAVTRLYEQLLGRAGIATPAASPILPRPQSRPLVET